jgi:hypothetical protein
MVNVYNYTINIYYVKKTPEDTEVEVTEAEVTEVEDTKHGTSQINVSTPLVTTPVMDNYNAWEAEDDLICVYTGDTAWVCNGPVTKWRQGKKKGPICECHYMGTLDAKGLVFDLVKNDKNDKHYWVAKKKE